MSKENIKALDGSTNDGIIVAKEDKSYQVVFSFSNTLVKKMGQVAGAKFDKENALWNVPGTSAAQLADVIEDMRDFNRNNGVQVKDVEGGKLVLFDYNKDLNQVIGAVNKAEFVKEDVYAWKVPADSKALVVPEGQTTSYLDAAVNTMRGMAGKQVANLDEIKNMAAEVAASHGNKPGIKFAEQGKSYSGKIEKVNGNYAVQAENTKDGVEYMVIHDLAVIGDVFQGDDVRINYADKTHENDTSFHADMRTAELVKQQESDREKVKAVAEGLVSGAKVWNAAEKDGKYLGTVKDVTNTIVLVSDGREKFSMHRRDLMSGANIVKGMNAEITYKNGKSTVVDKELQKASQSVGR